MKVSVSRKACIGAGQCAMIAPTVFRQDETEGLVELLEPEPPAEVAEAVRTARAVCPAQAIRIDEMASPQE
jgi:ferredoxin